MKTGKTLKEAEKFECTIDPELLEAWGKLRRYGDTGILMDKFNLSRPVIDRAINFGYVKKQSLADRITKFFNDRLAREKRSGTKIIKEVTEA